MSSVEQRALDDLLRSKALADKSNKVNRSKVYGNWLIKHFDTVAAALREQPEARGVPYDRAKIAEMLTTLRWPPNSYSMNDCEEQAALLLTAAQQPVQEGACPECGSTDKVEDVNGVLVCGNHFCDSEPWKHPEYEARKREPADWHAEHQRAERLEEAFRVNADIVIACIEPEERTLRKGLVALIESEPDFQQQDMLRRSLRVFDNAMDALISNAHASQYLTTNAATQTGETNEAAE